MELVYMYRQQCSSLGKAAWSGVMADWWCKQILFVSVFHLTTKIARKTYKRISLNTD